jgi:type IV pilus biogenesis/stability protein PilW
MLVLVGFMGVVVAVVFGGLWLTAPKKSATLRSAAPQPPLFYDQPKSTSQAAPAKPTREQTQPKPKDATTITDVLAALQLQPEEKPRPSAPTESRAVRPSGKQDPRREQALQRAKEALEGPAPRPEGKAAQEPSPAPKAEAKPESATVAAVPPQPSLEVHASGKESLKFFTEGLRYQREGHYARAIEEYEKAVVADPGNLEAYNNLGVLFKETGRLDQAVEAFQRALALDPKYEKALNNLGVVRYLKGQYEEAISLFRQAVIINAENVESYTNLGIIYLLAERLEEARGAFERALQLDPKHAETHYNLALLYERRGIWPKAFAHYERFIELAAPKHRALVTKVRERLQTLSQRRQG